jgi:hypothetical protein
MMEDPLKWRLWRKRLSSNCGVEYRVRMAASPEIMVRADARNAGAIALTNAS